MTASNLWKRPKKTTGITSPQSSFRFPANYNAALEEFAARESTRIGKKISQATIIMNLTMNGSNFYRTKQSELAAIYEQLNKEKNHDTQGATTKE